MKWKTGFLTQNSINTKIFVMIKDKLFSVNIDIFGNSLVVFCGKNPGDLYKHLNQKKNKEISDFIRKNTKDLKIDSDKQGAVYYNDSDLFAPLLVIKNRKRDWIFFEALIHEVTHYVDLNLERIGAVGEREFRAYLTDSIFRLIRKKLY